MFGIDANINGRGVKGTKTNVNQDTGISQNI